MYAAWWRESMVAVKRFNKASDSIHELRMHTAVGTAGNDDCIIPLRGYCRRDNAVYLVMEYCPRCCLPCMRQSEHLKWAAADWFGICVMTPRMRRQAGFALQGHAGCADPQHVQPRLGHG